MTELAGNNVIRVLVVDDSPVARELLVYLLNGDPRLQVIGLAADGEQAVAAAERLKPDVITMDIHLPKLDGFGATRRIMETCPTRIVMVTGTSIPHEVVETFRALEAGALTVLAKPPGIGHPGHKAAADELLQTIKLMSEVQVVRRWARAHQSGKAATAPAASNGGASHANGRASESPLAQAQGAVRPALSAVASAAGHGTDTREIRMVAIGASTGGPLVLQAILAGLAPGFGAPILIVQHISAGFTAGFAEWLGRATKFPVQVARRDEFAMPGIAYVAPDGLHMTIQANGTIAFNEEPAEYGLRPSVSHLFRSIANTFGSRAVGILLTGMGRDGARELKMMQQAGALTIVQDRESAVIYGMPGEALRLDAADHVLRPELIATTLNRLVRRRDDGANGAATPH